MFNKWDGMGGGGSPLNVFPFPRKLDKVDNVDDAAIETPASDLLNIKTGASWLSRAPGRILGVPIG